MRRRAGGTRFNQYASRWLQAKIEGAYGEIRPNTQADYRCHVERHLIPALGHLVVEEIDREHCQTLKKRLVSETRELASDSHARDKRDAQGHRRRPLGAHAIRKILTTLAMILDEAVEDRLLEGNPARGKRMRIRVPKPERTFLEMDELALLLDAAREQDQPPAAEPMPTGLTGRMVAQLLAEGLPPSRIATKLEISRSTVSFHLRRLGVRTHPYASRQVALEILGRAGVRISELCNLKIGQVRLHGPDGGRFQITDSKTPTGVREVQMTPELAVVVREHIQRLRHIGLPAGPKAYLVPNTRGGKLDRHQVARIIDHASTTANQHQTTRDLPPLPHTTPHTLRRTYISIALLANQYDIKWVMHQVGHADSRMTLDVYAQLEQRAKRQHGQNFDRLIQEARKSLDVAEPSNVG
jgi:integrase